MKYHETESIAALRTRRSATDPGRHLRRGHGATAVTGMAPCAAGKSMEGVGVKKGVFAKEKQLEMRQPNSAIGKSEPCRQKDGFLKFQSVPMSLRKCNLCRMFKHFLWTDSADEGKKKQCPRSCFPYFFPFHLGSCQSLSNQRVWSGFIPELQADTSGDPYQNPPVTWLGNPQSKWRTRGLGKSSQKCAIC